MAIEDDNRLIIENPNPADTNEKEVLPDVVEEQSLYPGITPPDPLSKSQAKKRLKLLKNEEMKKQRRKNERERQRLKRQEAVAKGLPARIGPSRKAIKKRLQDAKTHESVLNVAIDLNYDDLMSEHDIAKCVKQCLRIYTINRRSEKPGQLHFTGIKSNGQIHAAFKKNHGFENWHVNFQFDKTHIELFPRESIVYLTCESDDILEAPKSGTIYIIGGLVDHNHYKGLCHQRATENGLKTARLPLSEHVDMKTRSVLSTFHVFEILMRVAEGKSWTEAILQTIPPRKGAKPKKEKLIAIAHNDDKNQDNAESEIEIKENSVIS